MHEHDFVLANAQPGPRIPGQQYTTTVLYNCVDCEWVEAVEIPGHWKLEQLTMINREPPESIPPACYGA